MKREKSETLAIFYRTFYIRLIFDVTLLLFSTTQLSRCVLQFLLMAKIHLLKFNLSSMFFGCLQTEIYQGSAKLAT